MATMTGIIDATEEREALFLTLYARLPHTHHAWLLETLVELQPAPACVHCGGRVLCANCAFARLTGWDEPPGHCLDELVPPETASHVWTRIGACAPGEYDLVAHDASGGWHLVHVAPVTVAWDGCECARLITVRELARLAAVEWVGGGITPVRER